MRTPDSIYRERFRLTLEHRPVDRCPIDLGGTPQSTVEHPGDVVALARHLGFRSPPPSDYDKFDSRILERFDVDFRRCGELLSFETGRARRLSPTEITDCWGIRRRLTGLYWEIVEAPLPGATKDDVAAFEFPLPSQLRPGLLDDLAARAQRLFTQTPFVVVGEHPVFGVLELACWLCGYDHVMAMMALDPEFIHLLFGKILAFQKAIIREYYSRLGPYLHITTSGDDFGTQKALFVSPQMWREFVKPYMRERIAYTAQFTDAAYLHHSCGAIADIIPDLIEIGVHILNPIQPGAAGMEPASLKAEFGDRLVFHGGLDTQQVLPSNDPLRIESAVEALLTAMNPRETGGYIFAPAHNLQHDVSPSAITVMYDTVLKAQRHLCP